MTRDERRHLLRVIETAKNEAVRHAIAGAVVQPLKVAVAVKRALNRIEEAVQAMPVTAEERQDG